MWRNLLNTPPLSPLRDSASVQCTHQNRDASLHKRVPRYSSFAFLASLRASATASICVIFYLSELNKTQTIAVQYMPNRYNEGSGGLTMGFHTVRLCIIAPGFNIVSFTMSPHACEVRPAHRGWV